MEAGRAWVRGDISVREARSAAFAVDAANYAAIAIAKERDWQYQHLLDLGGNL